MGKFLVVLATSIALYAFADLDGSYILPRDHAAIQYGAAEGKDRVAQFQQKLREGKLRLEFDEHHGYLPAVLKALNVPISSQVLVFSKTSFQAPRISPRMARSLYFTDDVYVGWVPGGDVLEFAAIDPRQGVMFYTMDQDAGPKARIDRRDECLQCHASGGTLGVPGRVVRSVFVERSGMPLFQAGGFVTDHRSPLAQRWGGWYVTGTHGTAQAHGQCLRRGPRPPRAARPRQGRQRHRSEEPHRRRRLPDRNQRHRRAHGAGASDPDDEPDHSRQLGNTYGAPGAAGDEQGP